MASENVVQFPGLATPPGQYQMSNAGAGGGDGGNYMEGRIGHLEADVGHIKTHISEIKTDIREIRNWGLAAVGLILTALVGSYFNIDGKISDLGKDTKLTQISLATINQKLEDMSQRLPFKK